MVLDTQRTNGLILIAAIGNILLLTKKIKKNFAKNLTDKNKGRNFAATLYNNIKINKMGSAGYSESYLTLRKKIKGTDEENCVDILSANMFIYMIDDEEDDSTTKKLVLTKEFIDSLNEGDILELSISGHAY